MSIPVLFVGIILIALLYIVVCILNIKRNVLLEHGTIAFVTLCGDIDSMNTKEPKKIGTRHEFRTWLTSMKQMNYTYYSKLSPERKQQIQEEYHKRVNSCRSTVFVVEQRNESSEDQHS